MTEGPTREPGKQDKPDQMIANVFIIQDICPSSWYCDGKAETINDKKAWTQHSTLHTPNVVRRSITEVLQKVLHTIHAHYVIPPANKKKKKNPTYR